MRREFTIITMERLEELLAVAPRERFGIPIHDGDFTVFELDEEFEVDPDEFLSLGRATPFAGEKLYGTAYLTCHRGRAVFKR